jgi:hypothetical protein
VHPTMESEYNDIDQRLAVCNTQWKGITK